MNEGVQRIYNEMQAAFLHDPIYSEPNGQYVKLTLENSSTSRVLRSRDTLESHIGKDVLEPLNEYEIAAVQLAYSEEKVTRRELAARLDRSPRLASEVLHGLVDKKSWSGMAPLQRTYINTSRSTNEQPGCPIELHVRTVDFHAVVMPP